MGGPEGTSCASLPCPREAAMYPPRNRPKIIGLESGKRNTNCRNYSKIWLVICGAGADPRIAQSRYQTWSCSTTKLQRALSSQTVSDMTSTPGLQTQRLSSWSIANRLKNAFAHWFQTIALFLPVMEKLQLLFLFRASSLMQSQKVKKRCR